MLLLVHRLGGAVVALRGCFAALCVAALVGLSACATVPNTSTPPDPLSGFNHAMLKVNDGVETVIAKPVDSVYRAVVPSVARKMLSNARANLSAPVTFANDLLQGQPRRASETLVRFLINSTAGFGGLLDVASAGGVPSHQEDFGQTLAVWGVGPGPYLVMPLFGPTTLRDLVGSGVDVVTDPTFWLIGTPGRTSALDVEQLGSSTLVGYDDARDDLELLRSSSVDFYEALRNVYDQHRRYEILNGNFVQSKSGDILDTLDSINGN